ncbi:Amidase signature domain [Trinorchestia longiramus]|nr:Amidase signature domain [Trinorchestia longiramus]
MEKILSLTLIELAQAYKQKSLSVSQVVQQVMAQISIMQDLNALISVTPEEKISRACAGAQERQNRDKMLGPLDGVPVVVKDNYCTSWSKTTCASHMLSNYTPPYTATLVNRLEAAGAIIMGKSNMDEFGMGSGGTNSVFGPTRNLYRSGKPYHLENSGLQCVPN